ncbi:Wzz/FepE/Etk N-terminal domain-containing protein [Spirosoma terrae]|uniref:Lipopolysaccharide biosynthesis protein n=1 Tax=Spirosoma terrae TaxID=1968276 RepID=A0A6L9LJ31_9BACT|nr:Wzz/FepE/Etk N-terminal domain-containing protein [Spirosoma terrae]NDU99261.1 lipopolysaccharide biosynthesis protein [Spirosoma terrae]
MEITTAKETRYTSGLWAALTPALLTRVAWQGRRLLLCFMVVFALLGVIIALLTTPEYVSDAKIMPEMSSGTGDMVKRLASVAGFSGLDLSETEGADAVRPDLYPNVLQSTPFILYLLNQTVTSERRERTTIRKLLLDTDNWMSRFWTDANESAGKISIQSDGPVRLTKQQEDLIKEVGKRVSAKLDTRSGVITITAKMPDANVAATVAQLAMNYLTQYVTSYRTEKARKDLDFYGQRLKESRQRYEKAQYSVFHYNDQHKNFVVQAATMEKQRMEAELAIAQTVYTELARQHEQARLKVQERTPVFKVLEPPKIPVLRTSPKRTLMVLVYALAGLATGMLYLLAQRLGLWQRVQALVQE